MSKELAVILNHNGVEIVADPDNLTSLTALWKAAGSQHTKRPNEWLKTGPANEFIDSLAGTLKANRIALTKSRRGRNVGGVWAHWQVAMAYAKWLSPEFHQAVNEGFRRWYEEEKNPSLKVERGVDRMLRQGWTPERIERRLKGIVTRKKFTATLQDHNCRPVGNFNPFQEASTSINLAVIGKTASEFKSDNGLPKTAKTRDHLTEVELLWIELAEATSREAIKAAGSDGNEECLAVVRTKCKAVKAAIQVMSLPVPSAQSA